MITARSTYILVSQFLVGQICLTRLQIYKILLFESGKHGDDYENFPLAVHPIRNIVGYYMYQVLISSYLAQCLLIL